MAWATSATNGIRAPKGHLRSMQIVVLTAHIALLVAMLFDRQSTHKSTSSDLALASLAPELAAGPAGSAFLALMSGLLLALMLIAANRKREAAPLLSYIPNVSASVAALQIGEQRAVNAEAIPAHEGLLARLNHDLRTPLNAIMGFADLMKAEAFGPLGNDRYRAYAAHMQTCGHDLLRATESTLAMASLLANPHDSRGDIIDFPLLIDDAWKVASRANGHPAIELTLALDTDIEVRCNFAALRQSLISLLGLACERGSGSGRIEIGARRGHGRVHSWISVSGHEGRSLPPRTGCRPPQGASEVDELAIGVSRTLLGLHGVTLIETCNRPDEWIITMSLEDAAQTDFFEVPVRTVIDGADYSASFFGAMPVSASRSA